MQRNKKRRFSRSSVMALMLLSLVSFNANAQTASDSEPATYSLQQIDQMTAPIALYPDQLVGLILMAATYPLEVVEANRWLKNSQNAQLHGDPLASALMEQPWDPSVKSLVEFPQILTMMDSQLSWTEQLGDAFLGQQADVMNSVQRLRQQAEAAGHLASTSQETVANQDNAIVIQPVNPQMVYVPYYNPIQVYGAWPYPDYQPYYFPPPTGLYYNGLIGFGVGVTVLEGFWGWDRWDWRHHRMDIEDRRFESINRGRPWGNSGVWAHDPAHRHGVPYNSPTARARFQGASPQVHEDVRGYAARPQNMAPHIDAQRPSNFIRQADRPTQRVQVPDISTHQPEAPAQRVQRPTASVLQGSQPPRSSPERQASPAFESFSREERGDDVRAQSQRGASSRSTIPASPPRSAPTSRGGDGHSDGPGHNPNEGHR